MDAANDIAEFLTTRRARITPEQAGLPTYGKRRVPGLRREEVASLAGMSVEYYKRLERGNVSGASELVLEGLARALQLDDAERAHLFDLARAAEPRSRPSARGRSSRRSAPSCSASSTRSPRRRPCATPAWTTSAPTRSAGRCTRRCSTAASSRPTAPASRSWTPPPPTSTPSGTASRPSSSRTCAPRRAATRTTASCRTSIGELSTRSDEFRVRWAAHNVRFHRTGTKQIHHPVVGELDLSLRVDGAQRRRGLSIAIFTAEPGSASQQALDLLASWTATPTVADALPLTGEPDEH